MRLVLGNNNAVENVQTGDLIVRASDRSDVAFANAFLTLVIYPIF